MQIENHKKKYALSVSELFHQSRSMKNSSRGLVKRKKSEDLFEALFNITYIMLNKKFEENRELFKK